MGHMTLTTPSWESLIIPRLILNMAYLHMKLEDPSFSRSRDMKENPKCKNIDLGQLGPLEVTDTNCYCTELRFYVPLDTKISHSGDVLLSQSLGLALKKLKLIQQEQTNKNKITNESYKKQT